MATYLLVRHQVQDFADWKRAYDAHRSKRDEAGLTEKYVLRRADTPNEVILLFEARDVNLARTFAGSADLKETMRNAGVVGQPDLYFLTE